MPKVNLASILEDFPFPYKSTKLLDLSISGIAIDSRAVKSGDLFVAMQGGMTDGHTYIPMAIDKGAVAVVGQMDMGDLPVPYIRVEDPRQALTYLAAAFYDWPGRKLTVIGVTARTGKPRPAT